MGPRLPLASMRSSSKGTPLLRGSRVGCDSHHTLEVVQCAPGVNRAPQSCGTKKPEPSPKAAVRVFTKRTLAAGGRHQYPEDFNGLIRGVDPGMRLPPREGDRIAGAQLILLVGEDEP